mmetsp:Transcript_15928/g.38276  ORF Transcript_15928/g.38276 Transcript_15928/m.38276 type:complete len:223 (-) Transcript_15928:392-1060(-)
MIPDLGAHIAQLPTPILGVITQPDAIPHVPDAVGEDVLGAGQRAPDRAKFLRRSFEELYDPFDNRSHTLRELLDEIREAEATPCIGHQILHGPKGHPKLEVLYRVRYLRYILRKISNGREHALADRSLRAEAIEGQFSRAHDCEEIDSLDSLDEGPQFPAVAFQIREVGITLRPSLLDRAVQFILDAIFDDVREGVDSMFYGFHHVLRLLHALERQIPELSR